MSVIDIFADMLLQSPAVGMASLEPALRRAGVEAAAPILAYAITGGSEHREQPSHAGNYSSRYRGELMVRAVLPGGEFARYLLSNNLRMQLQRAINGAPKQ